MGINHRWRNEVPFTASRLWIFSSLKLINWNITDGIYILTRDAVTIDQCQSNHLAVVGESLRSNDIGAHVRMVNSSAQEVQISCPAQMSAASSQVGRCRVAPAASRLDCSLEGNAQIGQMELSAPIDLQVKGKGRVEQLSVPSTASASLISTGAEVGIGILDNGSTSRFVVDGSVERLNNTGNSVEVWGQGSIQTLNNQGINFQTQIAPAAAQPGSKPPIDIPSAQPVPQGGREFSGAAASSYVAITSFVYGSSNTASLVYDGYQVTIGLTSLLSPSSIQSVEVNLQDGSGSVLMSATSSNGWPGNQGVISILFDALNRLDDSTDWKYSRVLDSQTTPAKAIVIISDVLGNSYQVELSGAHLGTAAWNIRYIEVESELIAQIADQTITGIILVNDITLTSPITISRSLTIGGYDLQNTTGHQLNYSVTPEADVAMINITTGNLRINNLKMSTIGCDGIYLQGNTKIALNGAMLTVQSSKLGQSNGAIAVRGNNCTLLLQDSVLEQQTQGTANGAATSGVAINAGSGNNNTISLQDSTITILQKYQRGIQFLGNGENATVRLVGSTIKGGSGADSSTYSRGISYYQMTNSSLEIVNSMISITYYPLVLNSAGLMVNISQSRLSGYTALYLLGANMVLQVKGSVLTGITYWGNNPSNSFGTVVLEGANQCRLLLQDCKIENIFQNGANSSEYLMLFSSNNQSSLDGNVTEIKGKSQLIANNPQPSPSDVEPKFILMRGSNNAVMVDRMVQLRYPSWVPIDEQDDFRYIDANPTGGNTVQFNQ